MGGPKRSAEDAIFIKVVDGELVEAVVLAPVCSPLDIPQ